MLFVTAEKEQGNAVFAIHFTVKAINLTNKMEHFSFKSGHFITYYEAYKDRLVYNVTVRILV